MARRHYSDADRAAALAVYDSTAADAKGRLTQAARQADVPRSSLQLWIADRDRAAPPEVRQEKRAELGEVWGDIAHRALGLTGDALKHLESLPDEERGKAALGHLPDLNRVAGTATDKHELLDGKPTERLAVFDDRVDTEVAADTIDFLERVKRRKAGARKTG